MTRRSIPLVLIGISILFLFAAVVPPGVLASGEDDLVSLARSRKRVLIADFGLGLCRQCKAQSEILERIRGTYKNKVVIRMVNVNKEHELTALYQVETIPQLVFFDPTGKVVLRKTGVMSYQDVSTQLARMGIKP